MGLTKNLAAEACAFGVRVNCLAPGLIATPLAAAATVGDPDGVEQAIPTFAELSPLPGRAGMPEDVANAVLWLASDESGYVNGQTIAIDAGLTTGSKPGDPNFADYCENNPDGFRIGNIAKRVVRNSHFAEGFYFYAKNERYLMLAKIALGGQIRRVIKYVSRNDLHK